MFTPPSHKQRFPNNMSTQYKHKGMVGSNYAHEKCKLDQRNTFYSNAQFKSSKQPWKRKQKTWQQPTWHLQDLKHIWTKRPKLTIIAWEWSIAISQHNQKAIDINFTYYGNMYWEKQVINIICYEDTTHV